MSEYQSGVARRMDPCSMRVRHRPAAVSPAGLCDEPVNERRGDQEYVNSPWPPPEPPAKTSVTQTVPAYPAGAVAMISLFDTVVKLAGTPPNSTLVTTVRPTPVI